MECVQRFIGEVMRKFSYIKRLKNLGLFSLEQRKIGGDLIWVLTIM